jgi:acetate kinase
MKILVLNSGSSSIKFQIFDMQKSISVCQGIIEQIGEKSGHIKFAYSNDKVISKNIKIENHSRGIELLEDILIENKVLKSFDELGAVGHRVVHGGEYFSEPTIINDDVIQKIEKVSPLAPLHNPVNLIGIKAIMKVNPALKQVAVFDTAFHQSIPDYAYHYALPYKYYSDNQVRRYGFHGTSHHYVAKEAAKLLKKDMENCNLVTLHLGNGASMAAVKNGKSIDTSMGLTPLEGLVMGTRCGDIDPAIIFYLAKNLNLTIEELDIILNKKSGLKGLCGTNDMREVEEKAKNGDERAKLAFEIFCYRIKKYIGAYCVAVGKVDALVFTGGIGEHSAKVREKVCEGLDESLGILLDNDANNDHKTLISDKNSRIKLFVIATNEELEIAKQTYKLCQ